MANAHFHSSLEFLQHHNDNGDAATAAAVALSEGDGIQSQMTNNQPTAVKYYPDAH